MGILPLLRNHVNHSPQQLDTFATRLAQHYAPLIPSRPFSTAPEVVVGILGPSNLGYLITLLALTKLGHTVLFLSTRLSAVANLSLLKTTGAMPLLVDDVFQKMATSILVSFQELIVDKIARRETFEKQAASSTSTCQLRKTLTQKLSTPRLSGLSILQVLQDSQSRYTKPTEQL
jgi:acyl-CoA synthetase (AMP-forming)/AMP-acid ligase II